MVVVGHVDAGKSTLMGQVLVKMGHVSQRVLHKHEREAREQGKASFYLAWIMDEDEEERAHGVTIDVAQKHVVTETKLITLLDAPGHRDFIPKMISGACAADVAVLVVPATPGEFESCFESSGQTKEHALLVKALGVNQVVVAVNKLDAAVPPWDEGRYEAIKASVEPFLRQIGFKAGKAIAVYSYVARHFLQVRFVPVSGLSGENVAALSSDCPLSTWYRGDTFLQAIDRFTAAPRAVLKPMRMVCSDIAPTGKGVVVSGRLLQGRLQQGNRVLVMPIGDLATASRVEKGGAQPGPARAGDSVEVTLTGVDVTRMVPGSCLCKARSPVPVAEKLEAQVATLDALAVPLIRGTEFLLHLQGVDITAHVSKLIALTNSAGTVIKARPRCVPSGATAHVQLTLSRPICVERYSDCRALGRFVLRQKGQTVAVGLVLELKA
ncbi:P-loop containing nucleoside triphosphate hydrolase protein [Tribonema minus]|uniref:P-loop containing nucleoside triphosphate hydrolase protein n=1 Tax=Tribonema minus TaxID=303371 RepID=A0A836CAR8_9STRA|nr:P-loop containing nucleoside triphosphate hydrolase protein [Tribonema minus]